MIRYIIVILLLLPSLALAKGGVKFEKKKITVGSRTLMVEIAETGEQLAQGLMYRKSLDSEAGMLFIFPAERMQSFWMKNTYIPLSIGYFDKDKKLIEVLDMEPVTSIMQVNFPTYPSSKPAQYALEVNKGWFKKHGLKPGTTMKIQ